MKRPAAYRRLRLWGWLLAASLNACSGGSSGGDPPPDDDDIANDDDIIDDDDDISDDDDDDIANDDDGDDDDDPPPPPPRPNRLSLSVQPLRIEAGQSASVRCQVLDQYGDIMAEISTVLQIDGFDQAGPRIDIAPTATGVVLIACKAPTVDLTAEALGLKIDPGPPARVDLSLDVVPPWVRSGQAIQASWEVFDEFDNFIANPSVHLTGSPQSMFIPMGEGRFRLEGAGETIVTATADRASASVSLHIDDTPPELTLDFPLRGQSIRGSLCEGEPVVVVGTVADGQSGLASLFINDREIFPDPTGAFSAVFSASNGMNLLYGRAVDRVGNPTEFSQSYLYSDRYLGWDEVESPLSGALQIRLGEAGIDDGEEDLDDLAAVGRLAAISIDMDEKIEDPVYDGSYAGLELLVTKKSVTPLTVGDVTARAVEGGLAMEALLENFRLTLHVRAEAPLLGIVLANADAEFRVENARADVTLLVSVENGVPNATVDHLQIHQGQLETNLFCSGSACDQAKRPVEDLLWDLMREILEKEFADSIPESVEKGLAGIDFDAQTQLPDPFNITLSLVADFESIDASESCTYAEEAQEACMEIRWAASILSDRPSQASRLIEGFPLGCPVDLPAPERVEGQPVFGRISLDLLNLALARIWQSGGAGIDLTEEFGDLLGGLGTIHGAQLGMLTWPLISDAGEAFRIGLGDVTLIADMELPGLGPRQTLTIFASGSLLAQLAFDGPRLQIVEAEIEALHLDIQAPALEDTAVLETLVGAVLIQYADQIPQLVNEQLTTPLLPEIDLHQSSPETFPPGSLMEIEIERVLAQPGWISAYGRLIDRSLPVE